MAGPTAGSPLAAATDAKITRPTLRTPGQVALDRCHSLLVADSTARTSTHHKTRVFIQPPIHRETAFATTGTRVNARVWSGRPRRYFCSLPFSLWCVSSRSLSATSGPRSRARVVTYRSLFPKPPGRSEKKYSVVPSKESAGAPSKAGPLMAGPPSCWFTRFRFTGGDQTSLVVARVDTQRSSLPAERPTTSFPGRPEQTKISSPSRLIAVRVSRKGLLSSGTRTPGPKVGG